jgi:hypothetical protein
MILHEDNNESNANLCTPDFIRGVKYAIAIAKAEKAEILAEADDLVHDGNMEDMMDEIDALEGQAQAVQGVISKLQLRLSVMEVEGWIPEPEHLASSIPASVAT